jgi:hypothetical protein
VLYSLCLKSMGALHPYMDSQELFRYYKGREQNKPSIGNTPYYTTALGTHPASSPKSPGLRPDIFAWSHLARPDRYGILHSGCRHLP